MFDNIIKLAGNNGALRSTKLAEELGMNPAYLRRMLKAGKTKPETVEKLKETLTLIRGVFNAYAEDDTITATYFYLNRIKDQGREEIDQLFGEAIVDLDAIVLTEQSLATEQSEGAKPDTTIAPKVLGNIPTEKVAKPEAPITTPGQRAISFMGKTRAEAEASLA